MSNSNEGKIVKYFTFGEGHTASVATKRGFVTLDKDTVLKVFAKNPREEMEKLFGDNWDDEYDHIPDMEYFPGGIFDLRKGKFEKWAKR